MKNQGVQEEPDIENRDKEQGFGDDPEQAWYKRPM